MRKNKIQKTICKIIIIICITIIIWSVYKMYEEIEINTKNSYTAEKQSTTSEQTVESVQKKSVTIADTVENVSKTVVGISKIQENGLSIFLKDGTSQLGLGTGVIVTEDGYILSNEHVTGGKYSKCYVTLEDGNKYTANVIWSDSTNDLSIIKINTKNLNKITFGDSKNIRVGETVYAIGNPIGFEFQRTVTSGIISAKNRTIKLEEEGETSYMTDLIQTDASINQGNSGGPLILPNGELIGINTVKITTAEGIGFAVPINIIKPIIESLGKTGSFEEATLGIYAYDKDIIPYIDENKKFENGIYVSEIIKNGPASKTELKVGDIINKIDDKEITTMNELKEYIYTKKPGDEINLQITRNKTEKNIKIELGKK